MSVTAGSIGSSIGNSDAKSRRRHELSGTAFLYAFLCPYAVSSLSVPSQLKTHSKFNLSVKK